MQDTEQPAPDLDAWLARCAAQDAALLEAIRTADLLRERRTLTSEDDTLP